MVLAVLLIAACGGDDDDGAQPQLAEEQPSETVTERPTVETTTTVPPPAQFVVGDRVETALGNFVTLYSYEQPVPPPEFITPEEGNELAVADVEACLGTTPTTDVFVNPFDFELIMPDNTRRGATFAAREPALNDTQLVAVGDCVRGFVSFQVPIGQRPVFLVDTLTDPQIRWAIG